MADGGGTPGPDIVDFGESIDDLTGARAPLLSVEGEGEPADPFSWC